MGLKGRLRFHLSFPFAVTLSSRNSHGQTLQWYATPSTRLHFRWDGFKSNFKV